jgi:hypothetical protein
MSSPGRDRGKDGGHDTDHLMLSFLAVIQRQWIKNISRTEGVMLGRRKLERRIG